MPYRYPFYDPYRTPKVVEQLPMNTIIKLVLGFCLVLIPSICEAQTNSEQDSTIKLLILDDVTGKGVSNAHIFLYCKNKTKASHILTTNEKGAILLPPDVCRQYSDRNSTKISISSVGYVPLKEKIDLNNKQTYRFVLKEKIYSLDDVVVTAFVNPRPARQALHKVDIIGASTIRSVSARSLDDLLRFDSGIDIQKNSVFGKTISIQGLGGENVQILKDGVPIIGRLDGQLDISHINLANVEQVEIVEGPMSVYYGTNALAGIINLVTTKKGLYRTNAYARSSYESAGELHSNVGLNWRKKNYASRLSGYHNSFNGYKLNSDKRKYGWEPNKKYGVDFMFTYFLEGWDLTYQGSLFQETIESYGEKQENDTAIDTEYLTSRNNHSLKIENSANELISFNGIMAYQYYNRESDVYQKDFSTGSKNLIAEGDNPTSTNYWMSRAALQTKETGRAVNVQIGYDFSHESTAGDRILDASQSMTSLAGFVTVPTTITDKITIQPGVRYGYNSSYNAPLTPSLGVKYFWNDKWTFNGSYARGYRSPSIKELYLDFRIANFHIYGNENLDAEYSHHLSISANYESHKDDRVLSLDLSSFHNRIKDQIGLAWVENSNTERTYININDYSTWGGNAEIRWAKSNYSLEAGLSPRFESTDLKENFSNSDSYRFIINGDFKVQYQFEHPTLTIDFVNRYSGATTDYIKQNQKIVEIKAEPYLISDIFLSRPIFKENLNFRFGVKNIGDITTRSYSNIDGTSHDSELLDWGRSWFTSLSLNF